MNMNKRISTIIIQLVIAVIIFEVVLRIIYFQKNANDTFAFISAYKSLSFRATDDYSDQLLKYHNLVRPDSAHVNKDIVKEVIESNSFEYTPWVDFKMIDYSGKYINTKNFIRKSIPDKFINAARPTPLKVYLFGGSTMFGFNVTDKETIPSALAEIYASKCKNCPSLEIYNYGILSYYSYNELMLFTQLLFTNNKPDVAIFLDGLNDFFITQAASRRIPWYYYRLKENVRNEKDSTISLFLLEKNETTDQAVKDIADKYLSNIEQARKLCRTYEVTPLFFIQPNPYFNYPNKANDPLVTRSSNPLIENGYRFIEKQCDSAKNMYFLGNMLQTEKDLPFIDEFHYSPVMNKRIAAEIYERLVPTLDK